jgi:hypothetical protein
MPTCEPPLILKSTASRFYDKQACFGRENFGLREIGPPLELSKNSPAEDNVGVPLEIGRVFRNKEQQPTKSTMLAFLNDPKPFQA